MKDDLLYMLNKVSYSYLGRFPAISAADLEIREGERIALVGSNGSGKSTLLMILAALIFPQEGVIEFSGGELREESFCDRAFQKKFRKKVGIVFQNPEIQLFNSNVSDEISFGLTQLGLGKDDIAARSKRYMGLMDIEGIKDRHPQYLSVGEKKRVAIASTLAMEPEVLLLDEPTAGLDPRTSQHLIDAIVSFADRGMTVITATQDVHIVSEIAARVLVLNEDKRIVRDGPAEEVMEDNEFLQKYNLVHAHAHRHKGRVHVHSHEHPTHDHPHA